jgi:hypothetical protein
MNTYDVEFDVHELAPFRMPTDTLGEIDKLSEERRYLLRELSARPLDPAVKARMAEIGERLEELWTRRRLELRHTG